MRGDNSIKGDGVKQTSLLRLVAPLIAVLLFQAILAGGSLEIMSAVRAYVGGESLWSKGQKDAVHFITQYAESGDISHFRRFEEAIGIPLADRSARLELERDQPDLMRAREGLLQGGNHPDDVGGMIWLFRYFRNISYMAVAVNHWRATDAFLDELLSTGRNIHQGYASGNTQQDRIEHNKARISAIDKKLAPLALAFSASLGSGSRAIKLQLTIANILVAIGLIAFVTFHMRRMRLRQITAEHALSAEKEKAQVTLASIGDAVISTDVNNTVSYMNPAAERLVGRSLNDARDLPLTTLFKIVAEPADERRGAREDRNDSLSQTLVRPDATLVPVSVVDAQLGIDGNSPGRVLVLHDRTAECELVERLAWQASHDALTGLVNRREFEFQLDRALASMERASHSLSLMFLDLDQFKVVNDTCGHAAGDLLLKQSSDILGKVLGASNLLARLGGDEFGVLLTDMSTDEAAMMAERLRTAIAALHFLWHGKAFSISASIGLVHINDEHSSEEVLRAADVACYMAKEKGRNRVQIHHSSDSDMMQRVGEMNWVHRIKSGLESNRFCLYSQEIRSLRDSDPSGLHVELLLRLRDENGGVISPNHFMPAAERYGLMPLIDRWVVRNAFELIAAHLKCEGSESIQTCAINLSGVTFGDDDFVDYVSSQFTRYAVPPELICFEITESSAIANMTAAKRFIMALKRLGCRFSLDDFGTGMSSIAYLKHLPVDYIKIDGSFVREMLTSKIDCAMVEAIANIGKILGKDVIAEFVESTDIIEALQKIGVDHAQGYAIGRPKPFEKAALVDEHQRRNVA